MGAKASVVPLAFAPAPALPAPPVLEEIRPRPEAPRVARLVLLPERVELLALLVVLHRAKRQAHLAVLEREHLGVELRTERERLAQVRAPRRPQLRDRDEPAARTALGALDLE